MDSGTDVRVKVLHAREREAMHDDKDTTVGRPWKKVRWEDNSETIHEAADINRCGREGNWRDGKSRRRLSTKTTPN